MTAVSYVTTVYNKAPYLWRVAHALFRQTGSFSREFIFVDDGSIDDSGRILAALAAQRSDVRVITQPNRGPGAALNAGLAMARGQFVKPMDGDDELAPWATEALLATLARHDTQVAYADFYQQGHFDLRCPETDTPWPDRTQALGATAGRSRYIPQAEALRSAVLKPNVRPSSLLATRAAIAAAGYCDEGVFVQDYSMELRLARLFAFARFDGLVYRLPSRAPGRLSENRAQTLHDVNLALARFMAQFDDLPASVRTLALQRACGRAWKWARRRLSHSFASVTFARYAAASLRAVPATNERFALSCEPLLVDARVRLVAPEMRSPDLAPAPRAMAVSGRVR